MTHTIRHAGLVLALVAVVVAAPVFGAAAASASTMPVDSMTDQETLQNFDDPWWGPEANGTNTTHYHMTNGTSDHAMNGPYQYGPAWGNGTHHHGPHAWDNGTGYGQNPGSAYGPMMGWGHGPPPGQSATDGYGTNATQSGPTDSGSQYGGHGPQGGGHGGGHMGGW